LLKPSNFKAIKVQYAPEELSAPQKFSIDDVVVILSNNEVKYHQLKYIQNPTQDFWDLKKLLNKGLDKWITSFYTLKDVNAIFSGCLVTNGFSSDQLIPCIVERKISLNKIKILYREFYDLLLDKHSIDSLELFFDRFEFEFGHASNDEFERELRNILYYDLKVTKAGVDSLLLEIKHQGEAKVPKVFTLESIRSLLSWDNPRSLRQSFLVPKDFEFFNKHTHDGLLNDLSTPAGGIKVFVGKPGTGKSTYLSKLYSLLLKQPSVIVSRHHYHINPKDTSFRERLNSSRVIEGLKAAFKTLKKEVIGELSFQNTAHTDLKEFINNICHHCSANGKRFILIIDGLDHVIREGRDADELTGFLNEILFPQPAYWLLLGTQEMAVQYFPNIVRRLCPPEQWIEIKGIGKRSVETILKKSFTVLSDRQYVDHKRSIVNEIYSKTEGNPLHLRYVIDQIKNQDSSSFINSTTLHLILPYNGEISEYYADLWADLPPLSKTFALAVTSLDFRLQEEQLFELANFITHNPSEITISYSRIRHLLKIDLRGISVYHNSFLVFMRAQPELAQQKYSLYSRIRDWLRQSEDKVLVWSELAKIEYLLGNSSELLKIDKAWIVDSALKCYDSEQITKLINLAIEASFKSGDYKKVVSYQSLLESFSNRESNLGDDWDKIWTQAYLINRAHVQNYPDFDSLADFQIRDILIELHKIGRIRTIPEEAIERINEVASDGYASNDIDKIWLDLLAEFDAEPASRAYKFIVQFRQQEDSSSGRYFALFLNELLKREKLIKVKELLSYRFSNQERNQLLTTLIEHSLLTGSVIFEKEIRLLFNRTAPENISALYLFLRDHRIPSGINLIPLYKLPAKIKSHEKNQPDVAKLFVNNFHGAFYLLVSGKDKDVDDWLKEEDMPWQGKLMQTILRISRDSAICFKESREYRVSEMLKRFEDLPELSFYKQNDLYEYKRAVIPRIVKPIIEVISILNRRLGIEVVLDAADIKALLDCRWIYHDDVVDVVNTWWVRLSNDAYSYFYQRSVEELSKEIITFPRRASRYTELSIQAKSFGMTDESRRLLYNAGNCAIAYGNHKDMYLHNIMQCIEYCGDAGSGKVNGYLRRITSYVYNIEHLTNGDETSSFKYELAALFGKFQPNLLYNYYFEALAERRYYEAESHFSNILSCLNFTDPITKAIGNTAVDKNSFLTIERLADQDIHAKDVLNSIISVLGPIDYHERSTESNYSSDSAKTPDNLELILPHQLSQYFEEIDLSDGASRKYSQNDFLRRWCGYWLNKDENNVRSVVEALKKVIEPRFVQIDDGVLDLCYPAAFQIDKNFAFECLVWCYANGSYWSDNYRRNLKDARKLWNRAIADFPDRIDEFFERSVFNSGRYYDHDGSYFVPIPKLVAFYIDQDRLLDAERITENCLDSLNDLFPEVVLDAPNFVSNERQIDKFEIVLKRFEWVSPIVRERAGWHLVELLKNDGTGERHKMFFSWLRSTELESYACYGLLLIAQSLNHKDSNSFKFVDVRKGAQPLIVVRSMATDLILMKIANQLNHELHVHGAIDKNIPLADPAMSRDEFYTIVGTYLQNVYKDRVDEIEEATGISAWSIWCQLYTERCQLLKLQDTHEDRRFGRERYNYMTGCSTIFSEVLKSTFFSLLDRLYFKGWISDGELFQYVLGNFPVDLSLWNIAMSAKPEWWPELKDSPAEGKIANVELTNPLWNLINSNSEEAILYADGMVVSGTSHYQNDAQAHVTLLPFAYKIYGGSLPTDEQIFDFVAEESGLWLPEIRDRIKFSIFENELRFIHGNVKTGLKDLKIIPLTATVRTVSTQMWQYYRIFAPFRLFTPFLSEELTLVCNGDYINYKLNDEIVGSVKDFAYGIADSTKYGEGIPYGSYMLFDRKTLNTILESKGLRMGYVFRISFKPRRSSWSEDFESYDTYGTINLSRLII
jgi:hypothetical protein